MHIIYLFFALSSISTEQTDAVAETGACPSEGGVAAISPVNVGKEGAENSERA
jgi:hypothetical protein